MRTRRFTRWAVPRLLATTMVALTAAVVLLALVDAVWADRAGGGGGYSGGGGGGGGSGGGGGGGGGGEADLWLIYLLIKLVIEAPCIGIPLVIAILVFAVWAWYKTQDYRDNNALTDGTFARRRVNEFYVLQAMRMADPAFDPVVFRTRVETAFRKIQAAWCAQDLTTVRPFISDGIHERFLLQIRETRDRGLRDRVEGLHVHQYELAEASDDGVFDVLTVRITATARCYEISAADGSYVSGDKQPTTFVEYWSFIRRRGAKGPRKEGGLIEGNCPNCGAAIAMNQSANCASCKALLLSGEYDWALAEITQECEWSVGANRIVPGVAALRARDPKFNLQHLEDRASVIFWRRAMAERTGNAAILRKAAEPAVAEQYATEMKENRSRSNVTFYGDCAVGSVITLGVANDGLWDRAMVEIRWEGEIFKPGRDGKPPEATGQRSLFRTLFVLGRKAGTSSAGHSGLASAHCPSCGAAESASDSNACEYCGAVLNDGEHGWLLSARANMGSAEAARWLDLLNREAPSDAPSASAAYQPPRGTSTSLGALQWIIGTAAADGNVTPEERTAIAGYAKQCGVDEDRLEGMIAAALGGRAAIARPADAAEAREWIIDAADIALADGRLTREEYAVMLRVGRANGINEPGVRTIIRDRQSQRVRDGRAQIKQAKRIT